MKEMTLWDNEQLIMIVDEGDEEDDENETLYRDDIEQDSIFWIWRSGNNRRKRS